MRNPEHPVPAIRRGAQGALVPVLALSVGLVVPLPAHADFPWGNLIGGAASAARSVLQPKPAPAAPPAEVVVPGVIGPGILVTRPEASLLTLFQKRTVSGLDLIVEFTAMQALMLHQHQATAVSQLMGSLGPPPPGASNFDVGGQAAKVALDFASSQLKDYSSSIGLADLGSDFDAILGDHDRLARETISLPSPDGLTPRQMQRIVTMAAIVIATRITGEVLKRAQDDFSHVEDDYRGLIDRREKAAKLLYGALLDHTGSVKPDKVFSGEDLKFLSDNVSHMSLEAFSNDLGAQNLALRYLQAVDPKAYDDYKVRSDSTRRSTQGYIRATAGAAAFGALLVAFVQQSAATLHDRQASEIFAAFPFARKFAEEVPPVVKAALAAGAAGIVELPIKAGKRFRIVTDSGSTSEVGHAGEVFAAMKGHDDADALFTEALFRNGADGLVYKMYRCDQAEAGRLLDAAVPPDERDKFATAYIAPDESGFSFLNAFTLPGSSARERELGDELLRSDYRVNAPRKELGLLQRDVSAGYAKWGDEQLMRLIFANREGTAAQATLQLGSLRVRPIPSAQSVYAYESLVDGCARQFGGGAARPAASDNPKPNPAAQPKPGA